MLPFKSSCYDKNKINTTDFKFYSLAQYKVVNFSSTSKRLSRGHLDLVSSSHGWLTLFDRDSCELFLFNPLSGRHITLPPIHTLPIPDEHLQFRYGCVTNVITSCSPEQQDCRVMMSYGEHRRLAFCSPTSSAEWTPIGRHDPLTPTPYQDFVYSTRLLIKGEGLLHPDQGQLMKVDLVSIVDSWDTLVVSVSNSAPNGDLTLQVVKDCLLNEESRRKEQAFSTEQNALVTENSDRRGRNKSRGPQHQRDKSGGKSKFKGDFKCHYCGGPNHYERDCRKKKRDQKNGNNENKKDDKDTTAVATDGDVVIICDDACVSSSCQETDWIIDSGASYHITPHRDMFTSYTSGNFGRVRMANHGVTEVIGMGNINLETDTACRLILRDVRHIPDIRLNIISNGKLDDDGYVSNFGEGKWKLTKGSLITAKGKKKNSLYLMQAKLSNGEVNAAVNNSSIELWHKRLGHLSQKGMQLLAKKKLLPDVNGIELQTCVDCLAGKQHREQTSDDTKQSERKESTQEVPDDLDPVPSRTTQDHGGDVQDEQNDITDDEPVDDQVPSIQTDDPVPPPEARHQEGVFSCGIIIGAICMEKVAN
ncbi:hypothetical protein BUALT_Bualt08G0002500 [Buddleja alternifolia]|uniref:CCHC-type domain-containing protein n=1 Tax=Buddleja alternifolia TaxID=168488 RepID=A0AAV6X9U8_9LAMI|nr:hypothetical protein BUALT_Bualt08G0002500 [Buddleja alternifolia]